MLEHKKVPRKIKANDSADGLQIDQLGSGNLFNVKDGGTPVVTVADGGNVGIGIIAPTAKFNVVGTSAVSNVLRVVQNNNVNAAAFHISTDHTSFSNTVIYLRNKGTGDLLQLANNTATNTVFNNEGFLVIGGTSTSSSLEIIHSAVTTAVRINQQAAANIFELQDNGTPVLTVADGGDMWFETEGSGLPFGEIYVNGNVTDTDFTDTGVANKSQITIFDTDGESNLTTPSNAQDHITIVKAGKYFVSISLSVSSSGGDSDVIGFSLWKNNGATEFDNVHAHRLMGGGAGDEGSVSLSGIVDLAVDDTVELWAWNEDDDDSILLTDVTLSIMQLGGT